MYGLKTESSFDAAHFLTDYHGKCENLHEYRWRVVAYLEQEDLQSRGTMKDMVLDFRRVQASGALHFRDRKRSIATFIVEEGSLSPQTIACLEDLKASRSVMPFRTTAENLARYFFDAPARTGLPIAQIDVYETPNNCAILPRLAGKESADRYGIRFLSYSRHFVKASMAKARTRVSLRRSSVFRAVTWLLLLRRSGRATRSSPLNS